MPQLQMPVFPHGATEINTHLAFKCEGDDVTYLYGHLPIFTHHKTDMETFRMFLSQLHVNGKVKQSELCRAFGITPISVKRSVKLYRKKGTPGFYKERKFRGAGVLTPSVLEKAQARFDEGVDVAEVAQELGIKKDTLRKAIRLGRLHKGVSPLILEDKKKV